MSRVLEVTGSNGHLGAVFMASSNVEKFRADFDFFLDPGVLLTGIVLAEEIINDDAVANGFGLTNDRRSAIWYMESPDDPAVYDLSFTVTTNDGQSLNYTVQYNVGDGAA